MAFTSLLRDLLRDDEFGDRVVPDRPRRSPHLRHGLAVPRVQDLRPDRPAVRAGRSRPAALLHRERGRSDPRGGHHRGGFDGALDRRRHRLRQPRRADGALLHLLLDVRVPAGRRLDLGGRRCPNAWVPHGGHRRSHDPGGRGPPAPGRPQPCCSPPRCRPARPTTPPSPTSWAPSSATASTGCTRAARRRRRGHLLLPHHLQRELRAAASSRPCRRRATSPAASTSGTTGPRAPSTAGHDPVLRAGEPRRPRGPGRCSPSTTTCRAELWSVTSYKRLRDDALDVERRNRLHPENRARDPRRHPASSHDSRGADRRRLRLHDRSCPTRSRGGSPPDPRRSAPTASAAPTPVRRCARFFEVDAPRGRRRAPRPGRRRRRSTGRTSPRRSAPTASIRTGPTRPPRHRQLTGGPSDAGHPRRHRRRRRRPPAQHRPARTADRHAARPTDRRSSGRSSGPRRLAESARRPRSTPAPIAAMRPDDFVEVVPRPNRHCTAFPPRWAGASRRCARTSSTSYDGDARDLATGPPRATMLRERLGGACRASAPRRSAIFMALLAKRFGVAPEGWEEVAGAVRRRRAPHRSPTSTPPEALVALRESRRAQKAAGQDQDRLGIPGPGRLQHRRVALAVEPAEQDRDRLAGRERR